MNHFIKKYNEYKKHGYSKEQVKELLEAENLTDVQRKLILETVYKVKK